ncbi:hypothetical protein CIB84_015320, partial [Bambusicola thoracicus]
SYARVNYICFSRLLTAIAKEKCYCLKFPRDNTEQLLFPGMQWCANHFKIQILLVGCKRQEELLQICH